MRRLFGVLAFASIAWGCGDGGDESAAVESAWGHFDDAEYGLRPGSPFFLINKKPNEAFRVCLPRYMDAAMPGIRSEIDIAVNVWGAYIGRSIPVQVEVKDLPPPTRDQTSDTLAALYNDKCGSGFDVVLGTVRYTNDNLGSTSPRWFERRGTDGKPITTSFTRYLFLRDYALSDSLPNVGRWVTLEQLTGQKTSARDGLSRMLKRNEVFYPPNRSPLTLALLTHEFGHVWGMCDQYESVSNCDPLHSTSHIVADSMMGTASVRARLYLQDDDVAGIRALAARPGFSDGWGAPPRTPPARVVRAPLELLRIESAVREPRGITVRYGVVTSVPATYRLLIRESGKPDWLEMEKPAAALPIDIPGVDYTITTDKPTPRWDVRVEVTVSGKTSFVEKTTSP